MNNLDEAKRSIDAALALGDSPRREAALTAAGFVETVRGDFEAAEQHYHECRERGIVDPEVRSDVMNGLLMLSAVQDRPASELVALGLEAVEAAREVPHTNALAVALNNLAVALDKNDSHIDEVLDVVREGATLEAALDAGTGTRLSLALLLADVLDLAGADRVLFDVRDAASSPRSLVEWWTASIIVAGERGRRDEVADCAAELLRVIDQGETALVDDQLGSAGRDLAERGFVEEATRVLRHAEHPDKPALVWLALQSGDISGARDMFREVDPTADSWGFCVLGAEIEIADGHPERVEAIVEPARQRVVERGRLRGERRLLRVLRDAAEAQGVDFAYPERLAELDALADR